MRITTMDVTEVHEIIKDLRTGSIPTRNELVLIEQWLPFAGGALPNDGKERFRAALRRLHSGKPLCFYDHQLLDELLERWDRSRELADKCVENAKEYAASRRDTPWQT